MELNEFVNKTRDEFKDSHILIEIDSNIDMDNKYYLSRKPLPSGFIEVRTGGITFKLMFKRMEEINLCCEQLYRDIVNAYENQDIVEHMA